MVWSCMKEWEKHLQRSEEKLKSANILRDNDMLADSISEAYYSMYHAAKSLLSLKNVYPRTHAGLVAQFGLEFVTNGLIEEFYAKSLAKAEAEREKADYDIFFVPSKEESDSIIGEAEEFLDRIKIAIDDLK